jgi:hypothetical protein
MTARYGVQGALNETGHGSELLLRLESLPLNAGEAYNCGPEDKEIAIEGYSPDEVEYYLALLWEIGFIDCPGPQPLVGITFLGFGVVRIISIRCVIRHHDQLARQAFASLGVLYYRVPRFPLGFADEVRALHPGRGGRPSPGAGCQWTPCRSPPTHRPPSQTGAGMCVGPCRQKWSLESWPMSCGGGAVGLLDEHGCVSQVG